MRSATAGLFAAANINFCCCLDTLGITASLLLSKAVPEHAYTAH
jgi:hypothetical protein